MQNNSFFKHILFLCIVVLFASCDKDFNEIGSDVIGDDHFGLDLKAFEVTAFNQNLGSMQSNNLPINALGYYNNPVFGKTKASVVTQLELAELNPTFGTNPTVTKVELSLPYFVIASKTLTDATTGDHTYTLDSVHGSSNIKLSVYESLYYLRDNDASSGFQDPQRYYSGDGADFDNSKNPNRLNDDNASANSQNDAFFFDPAELKTYKIVDGAQVVDTRSAPGMRLNLNKSFFQAKIFGTGAAGKLVNNNVFKDYFRGLYFKVDNTTTTVDPGSLAQLNFKQGKITVTYTVDVAADGDVAAHTDEKTLVLNLRGNTVNVFENAFNSSYVNAVTTGASPDGDARLYPKGGAGSLAVIDLFNKTDDKTVDANGILVAGHNGVSDQLDSLRNPIDGKKLLVNEANLVFTIDRTAMGTGTGRAKEPSRIYLYDLTNKRPLVDYYADPSLASNSKFNKYVFGGIIEKKTTGDKEGIQYKIRLTNHIRNLIKYSDSTNVRLGLVVTEDIRIVSSAKLKTPVSAGSTTVSVAPTTSVLNPFGTVLYGSKIPLGNPDYDKRVKLQIYYTKPK